ncbi:MAG: hypothetical protein JWN70_6147 [Planctomycetaceae bacterium]|nr:hypothetical protein [Planctomycetaceae bacterium]
MPVTVANSMQPVAIRDGHTTWRTLAVYLACVLALLVTSCQQPNSTASRSDKPQIAGVRKNPPLPTEYAAVARHLTDSCQLDRDFHEPKPEIAQVIAQFKGMLVDLKEIKTTDAEVAGLVVDVHQATEKTMTAMERIDALPKPPSDGEMVLDGLLRGFVGDFAGGVQRVNEVGGQINALKDQARNVITGLRQLQTAKLQLPHLAKKHGGPPVVRGQTVLIDYDEAWGPHGPKSELMLVNNFGDLHNCTILIEIQGATEVTQNVHFLADWKGDCPIYASYSPGIAILDETPIKQSVPAVQRLVVSIWADELTQENIQYQYAGNEQAKDVARYCKDLKISLEYRPFQKGSLWNTHRGIHLQLDGIEFIEQSRVTVTFRRGQENKSLYWDLKRWQAGERKTLDTQGSLSWEPDEISVEIGFPATSYKHFSSWTLSNVK